MPQGKAALWWKYLRTSKRRRLLNQTSGLKVSFISCFFSIRHDSFLSWYCLHTLYVWCLVSCCPTGIFGGFLLGVRSNSGLAFYDWESAELIRRIEIQPKHVSHTVTDLTYPAVCLLPFYNRLSSCVLDLLVWLWGARVSRHRRVFLCAALPARESGSGPGVQGGDNGGWDRGRLRGQRAVLVYILKDCAGICRMSSPETHDGKQNFFSS